MNTVKVNAYAKLNLTLDVCGAEGGYHMLDSLVTTVDVFDRIVIKKRKDGLCRIIMHGAELIPPEENNALRAAEGFVRRFGVTGADITIYKNIPLAAGMGGSSADAAGVIAGMGRLYSVKDGLKELADEYGSDTGYLLTGGFARIEGRGERVTPLPYTELHFLLLVPHGGVSAGACYAAFDELRCASGKRTEETIALLKQGNLPWAARLFGNDLYPAAKSLSEDVERAYREAWEFSPLGAGMTGSGSAVYAVFETRELAEWAKSRYRGKFRAIVARSCDPKLVRSPSNPFALGEGEGEE